MINKIDYKEHDWLQRAWGFDFEVTKEDWILCAKNFYTGEKFYAHNDNDKVKSFIQTIDPLLIGFNNKHYDNYILKGILNDLPPVYIKDINDFIIRDEQGGWEYPFEDPWVNIGYTCDLMLDTLGVGLKKIEGYLRTNIKESDVSFDIDRALTAEEVEEMTFYCWHDVEVLEDIISLRMTYLESKRMIAEMCDMSPDKALNYTNAQLTARALKAVKLEHNDTFKYVIPDTIRQDIMPDCVMDYIHRFQVGGLRDKETIDFDLKGCIITMGQGGNHGAKKNYQETASETRYIWNVDATSYYPSTMVVYGYLSRNVPDSQLFVDVLEKRKRYKALINTGKTEAIKKEAKRKADALKLIVNTTYGASNQKFNDLYDPLQAFSTCFTGQLMLIQLMYELTGIHSVELIQSNTDGIMFSFDKADEPKIHPILKEWEDTMGIGLEIDKIKKVVQKDVNNYVMIKDNGKIKAKGGYVSNYNGGSMKSYNYPIVDKAIVNYLLFDTPVEKTINECNDIFLFQQAAGRGKTYQKTVWYTDLNKK